MVLDLSFMVLDLTFMVLDLTFMVLDLTFMVLDLTSMVLDLSGQPSLVLDLRLRRIHPCTFTNLTFRLPRCMEPQNGQAPS